MKNILKIISLTVLLSYILLRFLFSCKTEKNVNCDAYSNTLSVPYQDTIVMESVHYHFEEEHACVWVKADTNVYCDTLYLEVYNEVK